MKSITDALLYGILDLGYVAPGESCRVAERMCAGGIDVLQLRGKNRSEEEIEAVGMELVRVTETAEVPLVINDFPQLVPAIGAQGTHVGQDDWPVAEARWRAGRSLAGEALLPMVGKSTHSPAQAVAAMGEGADYIGFGPLYATPTKLGRPGIGLGDIRRVQEEVAVPVFCIGGVKRENLETVLDAGARRVVIVSGILQAADIESYCRDVKARLLALHISSSS